VSHALTVIRLSAISVGLPPVHDRAAESSTGMERVASLGRRVMANHVVTDGSRSRRNGLGPASGKSPALWRAEWRAAPQGAKGSYVGGGSD
jgi:hypothetical protein